MKIKYFLYYFFIFESLLFSSFCGVYSIILGDIVFLIIGASSFLLSYLLAETMIEERDADRIKKQDVKSRRHE